VARTYGVDPTIGRLSRFSAFPTVQDGICSG
jgi:hypothetical protein